MELSNPREARKRLNELQQGLAGKTRDRPNWVWAVWRLKVAGNEAGALRQRAEIEAEQAAWDVAHPDIAQSMRELDALEQSLQPHLAALQAEDDARERRFKALKCLDNAPRVQAVVAAGDLQRTEAVDAIDEFARQQALWCLLLLGGVGAGKSTGAGKAAFEEALANHSRRWSMAWLRPVTESLNSAFGEEARGKVSLWRGCSLLVIDDIGTEMVTPTWQQCLDDVLDHRYQYSLRTIITSNLGGDEFKKRYGERIADRIREDGMVVTLANKSMRRKVAP